MKKMILALLVVTLFPSVLLAFSPVGGWNQSGGEFNSDGTDLTTKTSSVNLKIDGDITTNQSLTANSIFLDDGTEITGSGTGYFDRTGTLLTTDTANDSLQIDGNIGIGATPDTTKLYIAGDASVTGELTTDGSILCSTIDTGSGNFEIGQSNRTTDDVTFDAGVFTGTVNASSNLTSGGYVVVGPNNDTSNFVMDAGDVFVSDDFEVDGLGYFDQTLVVEGDLTCNGNFFLGNGSILNMADLNITNDLTVQGSALIAPTALSLSGNNTLTGAQVTNGIIYIGEGTQELPPVNALYSATFITIGAKEAFIVPNASDKLWLDGTALDDGDQIGNASTAGDIAVVTYKDATGYHVSTNSWTDQG